jgi:hypothetical protein
MRHWPGSVIRHTGCLCRNFDEIAVHGAEGTGMGNGQLACRCPFLMIWCPFGALWCPRRALFELFGALLVALRLPSACPLRCLPVRNHGRISVPFCFPFCSLRGHEEGTTIRPQYEPKPTEVPPVCFKKGCKKPDIAALNMP